jgi:hypothetical protein
LAVAERPALGSEVACENPDFSDERIHVYGW